MYSLQLARRRELEALERARVETLEAATVALNCPRLSALLRHAPSALAGQRLHASSRLLRVLDLLPPAQSTRCTSVYLGHNLLRSLRGIEQFTACATLSLAGNPLTSWAELRRLYTLRHLQHVSLADTPLSTAPYYRARALVALCDGGGLALASLDGAPVGAEELRAARAALRAHDAVLGGALAAEWGIWGLAVLVKRLQLHAELVRARWGARRSPGPPPPPPPPPPPRHVNTARLLALWGEGFPRARVGLSLWRVLEAELEPPEAPELPGGGGGGGGGSLWAEEGGPEGGGAPAAAAAGEAPPFPASLLSLLLREVELKAAAYVQGGASGASDAQWRAAFGSLAGVQAQVTAELQQLAAAASEALAETLEALARRDGGGVLQREEEGVQRRGAERLEEASRTSAALAGTVRALKWRQTQAALQRQQTQQQGGAGGGGGGGSRALGSGSARSSGGSSTLLGTTRSTPLVHRTLSASRQAALRASVDPFTAAVMAVTGGRGGGDGGAGRRSAAAAGATARAPVAAPQAAPQAPLQPAAAADSPRASAPAGAGEDAHLSTLARLLEVVSKGSRPGTHAPAPDQQQQQVQRATPPPAGDAHAPQQPLQQPRALPQHHSPQPPFHATLERELETMDPPTLRSLVTALTHKLAEFAEANAHNAGVCAQQVVALTERAEAAERRAAAAEAGERAAREAGEAAGAVLYKEAAQLREKLAEALKER